MCAWATIEKSESASFADIVFEEKLRNLQTKKGNSALDVVKSLDQRRITTEEISNVEDLENNIQGEIRDILDDEDLDVSHPLENELISAASHGYKLRNSGKMIVKNCLKICNRKEENSNHDILNKEESVFDLVLYSDSVLYNFLTDLLHSINYVINLGKGSLILHATLDSCSPYANGERAKKCAIKYFKTSDPEPKPCTK